MKEILKYQDIDMQIKKIENDVFHSEERKNASKMQQYLKDCQTKLGDLNVKCEAVIAKYEQLKNVYDDMGEKLKVVSKSIEGASDKKLEGLGEASGAIISNLRKLEKEIATVSKQLEVTYAEFENIMKNARNAKKNLNAHKEAYTELKNLKTPEIQKLKNELKLQEKNIDKALLSKYLARHNEKNLPVFVQEIKGRCGGCYVEIAGRSFEKLKKDRMLECENCGRIIYTE